MLELWTTWRHDHVSQQVRDEWDISLADCWLVWNKRNNSLFQKFWSNTSLFESINSYITFWLENLLAKVWKTLFAAEPENLLEDIQQEQQADNGETGAATIDITAGQLVISAVPLRVQNSGGRKLILE